MCLLFPKAGSIPNKCDQSGDILGPRANRNCLAIMSVSRSSPRLMLAILMVYYSQYPYFTMGRAKNSARDLVSVFS